MVAEHSSYSTNVDIFASTATRTFLVAKPLQHERCAGCAAVALQRHGSEFFFLSEACAEPADAGRLFYAVLAQLCDGEALDFVQTADSGGWDAWRVLTR